jgi:hypothetical protein
MLDDVEGERSRCAGCWFGKTSSLGSGFVVEVVWLIEYPGGVGAGGVGDGIRNLETCTASKSR